MGRGARCSGRCASLPGDRGQRLVIAVDGDPLTDAKLFDDPAKVVLVIKDGQVVKDTR